MLEDGSVVATKMLITGDSEVRNCMVSGTLKAKSMYSEFVDINLSVNSYTISPLVNGSCYKIMVTQSGTIYLPSASTFSGLHIIAIVFSDSKWNVTFSTTDGFGWDGISKNWTRSFSGQTVEFVSDGQHWHVLMSEITV